MVELPTEAEPVRVVHGDCLEVLRELPDGCVDAVITDPPYPCIKRAYGYWTEAEWFALMNPVVEQCRRVLKPTGSAVFVLQPNSERVGRMRTWLWEFMAKWGREWGMVQDAYWWRFDTMPTEGAGTKGMLRQSVKPCVWLGGPECYRDQDSVLWTESDYNRDARLAGRCDRGAAPSRARPGTTPITTDQRRCRAAAAVRGGVTPFNCIPMANGSHRHGHTAPTSLPLCRWWVRYICPPGGTVLEPFLGSGTVALAALAEGRKCVGIERDAGYCDIARRRVAEAMGGQLLTVGAP